jgi:amino acid transporter
VSVAAGTAALASAFSVFDPWILWISIAFVVVIAWGNLRGVRESGKLFAVPTYFFIVKMGILIGVGVYKAMTGGLARANYAHATGVMTFGSKGSGLLAGAGLAVVLHSFASGGAAVTGVEAISNGVSAFKKPEWKNARDARHHGVAARPDVPRSFDHGRAHARGAVREGHTDRDLADRQARVRRNGIIFLAVAAMVLLLATDAKVDRLIPLYAIGVFTSFTLSHAGMAKHHIREKEEGWRFGLFVNGTGAFLSLVVDAIIVRYKFTEGAWVIVIFVPIMVFFLMRLAKQYETEDQALAHDVPKAVHNRCASASSSWCSSTGSTSRSPARSSSDARSVPTSCARCTSSSTRTARRRWPRNGASTGSRTWVSS